MIALERGDLAGCEKIYLMKLSSAGEIAERKRRVRKALFPQLAGLDHRRCRGNVRLTSLLSSRSSLVSHLDRIWSLLLGFCRRSNPQNVKRHPNWSAPDHEAIR